MQEQIISGWNYFDPRTYAEEVLGGAPLFDGAITVEDTRFLPHVRLLRRLKDLRVNLAYGIADPDIELVADLPALTLLRAQMASQNVDLSAFAHQEQLRRLIIIRRPVHQRDITEEAVPDQLFLFHEAEVDLTPLKDSTLTLWLSKHCRYRGLKKLGPGVTVKYES